MKLWHRSRQDRTLCLGAKEERGGPPGQHFPPSWRLHLGASASSGLSAGASLLRKPNSSLRPRPAPTPAMAGGGGTVHSQVVKGGRREECKIKGRNEKKREIKKRKMRSPLSKQRHLSILKVWNGRVRPSQPPSTLSSCPDRLWKLENQRLLARVHTVRMRASDSYL